MAASVAVTGDNIAVQFVDRLYKVAEVAALLSVGTDWVYERIADGTFAPVVQLGDGRSSVRISASVLQAYIDQREVRAA